MRNIIKDRVRGSLIGGAIGDALGYPVEFIYSYKDIQAQYGKRGITRLDTRQHWMEESEHVGKAVISDDTQMTLFTANGLLNAKRFGQPLIVGIKNAYLEWYYTQTGDSSNHSHDCWIAALPELNKRRAPGLTCMSTLETIARGGEVMNDSKGCGGLMRIAPIPLYAAVSNNCFGWTKRMSVKDASLLAVEAAKITHKNPLGFIPAALESFIIYKLVLDSRPTKESLLDYVYESIDAAKSLFPQYSREVAELRNIIIMALKYAEKGGVDYENVESIGEGWVADEALAIALYCAVRHFNSFEDAMIAAVNHRGDSDSTGSVCGSILGAAIGYDEIPQFFKDDLEMHDLILHIADDVYCGEVTSFDI